MPPSNYLFGRVAMSGKFVTSVNLQALPFADLPTPSQENLDGILVVSDGAGGFPVLAQSNGAQWVRTDLGIPVSVTGPRNASIGGSLNVDTISGVTVDLDLVQTVRRAALSVENLVINVPAASDFGGAQIVALPDSNIIVLGIEVVLDVIKGGQTNGIVAATDLNMSVGTAIAGSAPPSGTAADVLPVSSLTANSLAVSYNAHTNAAPTPSLSFIDDGPSSGLFLNVGVTPGITADDSITVGGSVDIYYIDTGNVAP